MWDLVPWPGIEPGTPSLGAWSLNHCATRGVLTVISFYSLSCTVLQLSKRSHRRHSPSIPRQPLQWNGACEPCAPDFESRPNRASSCGLHRRSSLSPYGSHTYIPQSSGIARDLLFWQWTPDSSEDNWFWGLSALIVACTLGNWQGLRLAPRKDRDRTYRSCVRSPWWLGLEGNSGTRGRWALSGRLLGCLNPFFWGKEIRSLFLYPKDKKGPRNIRHRLSLNNTLLYKRFFIWQKWKTETQRELSRAAESFLSCQTNTISCPLFPYLKENLRFVEILFSSR